MKFYSVFFLSCVLAVLLSTTDVNSFLFHKSTVCYPVIGCFSSTSPFKSSTRPISVTPSSPDNIRTQFILYTRTTGKKGRKLDARKWNTVQTKWKSYFKNRETQFIVHGFLDDYNFVSWIGNMKDELLRHGDYNTIIVDWHHGNLPPYTQATANTRVVGAQIALLIKQLQRDFKLSSSQIHIIGHSLGSHVAGYAGERTIGLRRITGLDPAGPYFEGVDKVVRLDPSDADVVDVIHSDGSDILELGFGTLDPSGHMDFYPNLGHDQPGCKPDIIKSLLNLGLVGGVAEVVSCNHLRSIKYFTESINSKCPFWSVPCGNAADFKAHKCRSCTSVGCASMGFKAEQHKPPKGKMLQYYTSTKSSSPFCQYHLDVIIRMSYTSSATEERGRAKVRFQGDKGSSGWIYFNKKPRTYVPGSSYEKVLGLPADIGNILSVKFKWHHMSSLTNPLKWNFFGFRKPKLYIREIDILSKEQGKLVRFCPGNRAALNDKSLFVNKRC